MRTSERAVPIPRFRGLDTSSPVSQPEYTRSLLNVTVRDGMVKGRGRVDFNTAFSSSLGETITGLFPFINNAGDTTLVRHGPTIIESSTGAGWTVITGSALTAGATTDRPQYATFRDTDGQTHELYFTHEGRDRLRRWIGSGNTAAAAADAPWCKAVFSYFGFLFALHTSTDGSEFFPRRALYSDLPSSDWSLCVGNELNFNETPGACLRGVETGQTGNTIVVIFKTDGLVYLRWIGGKPRFEQKAITFPQGIIAPLSAQAVPEKGVIFLAGDYELNVVNAKSVEPLPPNVNDILQNTLYKPLAGNCRSAVIAHEETYSLFYPADVTGITGRITFNYRTAEFSHSTYDSHIWTAITGLRWGLDEQQSLIGAHAFKTYTLDAAGKNDEVDASTNTEVTRRYDTDWMGSDGQDLFSGTSLTFTASPHTKCAISYAVDHKNQFRQRKVYSLRPVRTGDEYVHVRYDVPPVKGYAFNVRIELIPSNADQAELRGGAMYFISNQKQDIPRGAGSAQD